MYEKALEILKKISNIGYEAYIIGGYPRDMLLNIKNEDIDICTSADVNIIKNMFDIVDDNSRFGSLRIRYANYLFEITTFRVEISYKSRYPKILYTSDLKQDLLRRDFTINTICIDKDGKIIDYMNALNDINNKVIKVIGNIDEKLKEDPLRILRAIRFAGKLNFNLDNELYEYIVNNKELVSSLTKPKAQEEISKMNDNALNILKKLDLYSYIRR